LVIGELHTAVGAMHLRLYGVLIDLEVPVTLRTIALPPEESLISREANFKLELIRKGQENPFNSGPTAYIGLKFMNLLNLLAQYITAVLGSEKTFKSIVEILAYIGAITSIFPRESSILRTTFTQCRCTTLHPDRAHG